MHPTTPTRTTLYDAFAQAAADAAQRPFLACTPSMGGAQWTFAQTAAAVDRLSALYARRGWGAGHRVALSVGNTPAHFFHFLAMNRLGISMVPMNPDHLGGEIRYQLAHSRADLVVANAERAAVVRDALAGAAAGTVRPPIVEDSLLETGLLWLHLYSCSGSWCNCSSLPSFSCTASCRSPLFRIPCARLQRGLPVVLVQIPARLWR